MTEFPYNESIKKSSQWRKCWPSPVFQSSTPPLLLILTCKNVNIFIDINGPSNTVGHDKKKLF